MAVDRKTDLSTKPKIRKRLLEVFTDVESGFIEQSDRSDELMDNWDCYNCKLGDKQFYAGNSHIFVPIVKDAIKARRTRFVNQIFPQAGRYIDVTTPDGEIPHALIALAEHYIRKMRLRTQVIPTLMTCGDVEGQYSLYLDWGKIERHVVSRETKPVTIDDLEFPEMGEHDDVAEETIAEEGPRAEVLLDCDLLILPATVSDVNKALEMGGSVTIVRRWTKKNIEDLRDDGTFNEDVADALIANFSKRDSPANKDTRKQLAESAGIRSGGTAKFCVGYETWTKLKVEGKSRLCVAYYGGDKMVLGCKLNPYWCDLCPVITNPVEKFVDVAKGRAPLSDVYWLQVDANDAANEAADTAHFAAMPIIMTDPEKNPNVGSMVLGLASVWLTSPNDTKFAQFPPLWKDGLERIAADKSQIFQTLGVNPSMVPQGTGGKSGKRNQAEIANEQQVDILTTADAVTNIEEGILTPLVQRVIMYDHQFRNTSLMIRRYGQIGLKAVMEELPPLQQLDRYEFLWFGVEAARNAAAVQQQIAFTNVLKSIPPNLMPGYRVNLVPMLTAAVENVFGPRLAPLIFEDTTKNTSLDPGIENQLLVAGFDMMVHPGDDDAEHIKSHMVGMSSGDPKGLFKAHIVRHQQQMQQKAQAASGTPGLPGGPGGAGQPGVAGTPKPGAQPQPQRGMRGPPGMINADRMPRAGAVTMPRKM